MGPYQMHLIAEGSVSKFGETQVGESLLLVVSHESSSRKVYPSLKAQRTVHISASDCRSQGKSARSRDAASVKMKTRDKQLLGEW